MKILFLALLAQLFTPSVVFADMNQVVDKSAQYLLSSWKSDPTLEEAQVAPPQVLPIAAGSKIYGACGEQVSGHDLGGSAYCGVTHTIYLVPSELNAFHDIYGPSAVAYVVAHEFGHALQNVYGVELRGASRELHADCLAGLFIGNGSKELDITRSDVVAMAQAAYEIGSDSHGSGPQRAYALLSGMGVFSSTCSSDEMNALAKGTHNAPELAELNGPIRRGLRGGSALIDITATPYPKTMKSALGI